MQDPCQPRRQSQQNKLALGAILVLDDVDIQTAFDGGRRVIDFDWGDKSPHESLERTDALR